MTVLNLPDFLPPEAAQISEPTAVDLLQQMRQTPIPTPFSSDPIATTTVCQGTGEPPLLLIHGFDSSLLEFRRLIPRLSLDHQVWAVDLFGSGFTERLADLPVTPSLIRSHLYACWEALINRPVILVGASMGGAAAIDFALTYPDAVQAVVVMDSAGLTAGPPLGRFLFPPLDFLAADFLRRPSVRERIGQRAYHDPTLATEDANRCGALHLACRNWHRAMISFTKSGGYALSLERIRSLDRPTLILWGENDQIISQQDARQFHEAIAQSQLIWIPKCGHVPHLEQPDLVAEKILAFGRSLL